MFYRAGLEKWTLFSVSSKKSPNKKKVCRICQITGKKVVSHGIMVPKAQAATWYKEYLQKYICDANYIKAQEHISCAVAQQVC